MEKKTVGTERETDSHGRRILYDIFANTHTDFEDMVRPHTHSYFEIILIEEGVGTDTCGDAPIYGRCRRCGFHCTQRHPQPLPRARIRQIPQHCGQVFPALSLPAGRNAVGY